MDEATAWEAFSRTIRLREERKRFLEKQSLLLAQNQAVLQRSILQAQAVLGSQWPTLTCQPLGGLRAPVLPPPRPEERLDMILFGWPVLGF